MNIGKTIQIFLGEYSEDGLIVFAGSTCNLEETRTAGTWIKGMRKKLLDSKILIQEDNVLKFINTHIFSSPNAAAGAILGRKANGWIEWKYKDGKTLDEAKRQPQSDSS